MEIVIRICLYDYPLDNSRYNEYYVGVVIGGLHD
jgi:hypothetical protein